MWSNTNRLFGRPDADVYECVTNGLLGSGLGWPLGGRVGAIFRQLSHRATCPLFVRDHLEDNQIWMRLAPRLLTNKMSTERHPLVSVERFSFHHHSIQTRQFWNYAALFVEVIPLQVFAAKFYNLTSLMIIALIIKLVKKLVYLWTRNQFIRRLQFLNHMLKWTKHGKLLRRLFTNASVAVFIAPLRCALPSEKGSSALDVKSETAERKHSRRQPFSVVLLTN